MKCMKAIAFRIVLLATVFFGISGCTGDKIQIINNQNVVTNVVPTKAFNDETYVWENWQFSTNQVDKIEE